MCGFSMLVQIGEVHKNSKQINCKIIIDLK